MFKIFEDAQEIKRRLSMLGQNVDETVICELLESSGSDYKLDHIISIITENWDSGYGNASDEAGTFFMNNTNEKQPDIKKVPKHESMLHSSVENTYINTSDISSNIDTDDNDETDDDDDRDDYYAFTDLNDISVVDTVTRHVPSPSESCGNTPSPNRSSEAIVTPEVEFLEENNNDPNNNLDSVQILQELQNNSPDVSHERNNSSVEIVEPAEKPESPKPGCSKDSHNTFVYKDPQLRMEMEQISALLPNYKRSIIYTILCRNRTAKNRVELTLWDLLPDKRPRAQSSFLKRKLSDDVSPVEYKKNIPAMSKDSTKISYLRKPLFSLSRLLEREKSHKPKRRVTILDDWDSDSDFSDFPPFPIIKRKSTKSKRSDSDTNKSTNTKSISSEITSQRALKGDSPKIILPLPQQAGTSSTPCKTSQILRPSKLILSANKTSTPESSLKLSPPKLKCFIRNEQISKKPAETSIPIPSSEWNSAASRVPSILDVIPMSWYVTPENGKDKKASDMNIAPSHSLVDSEEESPLVLLNKILLDVSSERIKTDNNILDTSDRTANKLNSKRGKSDLSASANVDRSKNIIKTVVSVKAERDIEASQQTTLSISTETDTVGQLELANSLQSDVKQDQAILGDQEIMSHTGNMYCTSSEGIASTSTSSVNLHDIQQGSFAMSSTAINISNQDIPCMEVTFETKTLQPANNASENITLTQKALQIYYKLIPMFPSIDTNYIKQLCQHYVDLEVYLNEINVLEIIIEKLLDYGEKHPCIKKVEAIPMPHSFDVNEQYAYLLGVFPKADPTYLRGIAEEMYNDPEKLGQFIQLKLINKDYPTREEYLAKKKITEQQKQYTTDFQVQKFLEIFPDPFSHFENEKRQCQFNAYAFDFLKHRFNKIRVNTLLGVYTRYGHNLSLAVKELETHSNNMKSKRDNTLMQTENIPLLQECAFIQHKAELRKYLSELKEKEKREFEELKARNELLECSCCFDTECMPSKCSTCEDGHIFCISCIAQHTDVKLANGETHIHCLVDCSSEFPLAVLQHILLPTKFSILLQKRQEAEVMAAGLEGLVSCPFCHFASIPPQEDKVFKCFNPECMKESCRLCKEINHLPEKCHEKKTQTARLYLEEKMTEALVRKCYRCSRTFFKEEGCNKMTCVCGAQMCYICDQPVTNYEHFSGQGSTKSNCCPLWSDDRHMNATAVIQVCKETLKQIKKKNPEVEINTDALLPKLPPKIKGPHDDIAHANELPDL